MEHSVLDRLAAKGIQLPQPISPVGLYVPVQQTGNLVFVSGMGSIENGTLLKGQVGANVSTAEGARRAQVCMLNTLATLQAYLGTLDAVVKPIKLLGLVNCTSDFIEQAAVINAASQLLLDAFGKTGRHARSAIGSNSLPLGLTVEIESIFEIQ